MGTEETGTVTVEMISTKDRDPLLEMVLSDGMTLEGLMKSLELPPEIEVAIVNGVYVPRDYRLQSGDRVTIFPFLTGG
jgi:sulfur carrier protein ThiS